MATCKYCKKYFKPKNINQRHCTPECWEIDNKKKKVDVYCRECGAKCTTRSASKLCKSCKAIFKEDAQKSKKIKEYPQLDPVIERKMIDDFLKKREAKG